MSISEMIWGLIGFFLTIMVLSYLIGDNFFFRLASHLFLGSTAAYLAVLIINNILWRRLLRPFSTDTGPALWWMAVPVGLSLLLIFSQSRRFSGLGGIPLAYLVGLAAAVTIGGVVFSVMIPQSLAVVEAFNLENASIASEATWLKLIDAFIMLIGVISTLAFFYFGARKPSQSKGIDEERPTIFESLGKLGQVFVGITLGAIFAGVFSSALLALIEQLVFIGDFFMNLFGGS